MKYGMRFHAKTCTLGSMIDGRGEVLALLKSSCAIDQLIFSTSCKKAQSKSLVFVFTNFNMKIYVLIIKSWFVYLFQHFLVIKYTLYFKISV